MCFPNNYFEQKTKIIKTPMKIDEEYSSWMMKMRKDPEYWHINKAAYNGNF